MRVRTYQRESHLSVHLSNVRVHPRVYVCYLFQDLVRFVSSMSNIKPIPMQILFRLSKKRSLIFQIYKKMDLRIIDRKYACTIVSLGCKKIEMFVTQIVK